MMKRLKAGRKQSDQGGKLRDFNIKSGRKLNQGGKADRFGRNQIDLEETSVIDEKKASRLGRKAQRFRRKTLRMEEKQSGWKKADRFRRKLKNFNIQSVRGRLKAGRKADRFGRKSKF